MSDPASLEETLAPPDAHELAGTEDTLAPPDARELSGTEDTLAPPEARGRAGIEDTLAALRPPPSLPANPRTGPLDGAQMGRYTILRRLGAGAMGLVLAAYDPELDRRVALKLLLPGAPGDVVSTQGRRRLMREAQAMAKLNHPNVVTVHDVGEQGGQIYVAMELIEGETLGAWLARAPRTWRAILTVFQAAARGLAAAHAKGLIHRDFKPDNVMIGRDERVRVMDFGLARSQKRPERGEAGSDCASHAVDESGFGSIVGTPAYMPPEQWHGAETDARSDQFSFCAALWEAMYGERPFAGDSARELAFSVLEGQRREAPRRPSSGAPAWLAPILARGLETSSTERWPSMEALSAAIERGFVRRRRVLGGLGAAALAGLGSTWVGVQDYEHRQALASCDQAGATVAARWNEQRKTELETALGAALGPSQAANTLVKLQPWLDDWASSWTAARTETCVTATIDQTLEAELARRAEQCLEERRMDFEALLDELTDPSLERSLAQRSISVAASLRSPQPCTDTHALELRPSYPESQVEAIAALRGQMSRATATAYAGDFSGAIELIRELEGEAEQLGFAPLELELDEMLGSYLVHGGHHAEAEAVLRATYREGSSIAPEAAARAVENLVYLVGHLEARYAEGRVWAEAASIAIARVEPEGGLLTANLTNDRALIDHKEGRLDQALAGYAEVLATRKALLTPDHPSLTLPLNNMAGVHYAKDELDEAAAKLRQVIALREQALGPGHPDVAEGLGNLALVRQKAGAIDEALQLNLRALDIHRAILEPTHPKVAAALSQVGSSYLSLGQHERAHDYFERALAAREASLALGHPQLGETLGRLGDTSLALGRRDEARSFYARALANQEAAPQPDPDALAAAKAKLASVDAEPLDAQPEN